MPYPSPPPRNPSLPQSQQIIRKFNPSTHGSLLPAVPQRVLESESSKMAHTKRSDVMSGDRAASSCGILRLPHLLSVGSAIKGLAISRTSPYLFSVAEDKTVKCWDPGGAEGRPVSRGGGRRCRPRVAGGTTTYLQA